MALGSTHPQKWVPGTFPRGKGGRCLRLTTLPPSCAVVMKSGNLNFLESSGSLQASNGTALPFICILLHLTWWTVALWYLYAKLEEHYVRRNGQDNSVVMASRYRLEIIPGEGEIFRTHSDRPWDPPFHLCYGYLVIPPEKSGRRVALTTHAI